MEKCQSTGQKWGSEATKSCPKSFSSVSLGGFESGFIDSREPDGLYGVAGMTFLSCEHGWKGPLASMRLLIHLFLFGFAMSASGADPALSPRVRFTINDGW